MRKILRKNRRDRSRGGKKRRVMYKRFYVMRLSSLGATRHSPQMGKQENKGFPKESEVGIKGKN